MTVTLEKFITQLDESGVISAADIAAFQDSQSATTESAEDLAKLLVKHKKVTKLQAQMVFQGKGKNLQLGNYVIQKKIGAGGMGDVYLAKHRRMKRMVALKTLPAAMTKDQNAIRRFQREVEAAAKLTHTNIVTAHDADEANNGIHYFVMEYVAGIDLAERVKKQGVLSVDQALNYILQAATGLEYAHNKGVIHRDIKPSNLLLDNEDTIKILDMGLARIDNVDEEDPVTALTHSGSVMGTVDYMSPEQAQSTHTADARSDIYSLGCSFYYLLTGDSVYSGQTVVNRIMAHRDQEIPSLSSSHVHVPSDVDAVYQKMIAKRPEDRFQSMQEVIDAFNHCNLMKSSSTVSRDPSDPELHKFLQSQRVASSPTIVMSAEKSLADSKDETPTSDFLNRTLGGSAFQLLRERKKSIGKRGWIVVGTVLASLILLAGIILKVDTAAGTIVLEIDQPELAGAVVSVDEQKKITIKTGEGKEPIEVVADEKTHTLKVTKGGFETFTKQFTVKAGGKETIRVRLVPLVVATNTKPSAGISAQDNYALEFDGKTSYVDLPIIYDGSHPITMEAFILPNFQKSKIHHPSPVLSLGAVPFLLSTIMEESRFILASSAFTDRNNKLYRLSSYESKINRSAQHIATVYDGSKIRLYLNGSLARRPLEMATPNGYTPKGESKISLTKIHLSSHVLIGCNSTTAKSEDRLFFAGIIDEVRYSKVARYTKDFTPEKRFKNDEHTMALYHFDKGSGDVLIDSSDGQYDGKIVGAKWVKVDDELQVIEPATTSEKPMTDREVAEWVIGIGGEIVIGDKYITKIEQLPTTPFLINNLSLAYTSVKDDDLKRLDGLKTLKELTLGNTVISDTGVQNLKDIPLKYIQLINTQITDKGLAYLSNMTSLTTLLVASTAVSNAGVERLKDMKQLEELSLSKTQIDDVGLGYLADLTNLESLSIHNTPIIDAGLKHLKEMKQLSYLKIGNTLITNAGLKELVGFTNLNLLYLANCKISDSGLMHLKDLKSLKDLGLGSTSISDVGLQHLHGLKMLGNLNLTKTKVTAQGIAELQKALPNCKIISDFETKAPATKAP